MWPCPAVLSAFSLAIGFVWLDPEFYGFKCDYFGTLCFVDSLPLIQYRLLNMTQTSVTNECKLHFWLWFILSSDFQEDASQSWYKSSTVCTDVIKEQTQKKLLENGHEITNYNNFQCEINVIIRPDATKV